MVITTTSIAFILLGCGLGIFGWRLLGAFRKRLVGLRANSKTGFLISLYFFGFAFQTAGILGLGTFLFALSPNGLFFVAIAAVIFPAFLAMLGVYIIYYIFLPRSSPLPLMIAVLILGIIALILGISTHPQPFITSHKGIDWNMSFSLSLTWFYLLFISIGTSLYIFIKLFLHAQKREIKILSLIQAIIAAGGILATFFSLVVFHNTAADTRTRVQDIGQGLVGIAFISAFVILSIMNRKSSSDKQ